MPDARTIRIAALSLVAVLVIVFVLATCAAINSRKADLRAAEGKVASSQAAAGQKAGEVTAGVVEAQTANAETERKNRDAINATENAKTSAGDTGVAGRNILCQRKLYRDRPECRT